MSVKISKIVRVNLNCDYDGCNEEIDLAREFENQDRDLQIDYLDECVKNYGWKVAKVSIDYYDIDGCSGTCLEMFCACNDEHLRKAIKGVIGRMLQEAEADAG